MKVVDKMLDWENAGKLKLLSVGYSLREPQLLFRKIEDAEISLQVEKLKSGLVKTEAGSQKSEVGSQKSGTRISNDQSDIRHPTSDIRNLFLRLCNYQN